MALQNSLPLATFCGGSHTQADDNAPPSLLLPGCSVVPAKAPLGLIENHSTSDVGMCKVAQVVHRQLA